MAMQMPTLLVLLCAFVATAEKKAIDMKGYIGLEIKKENSFVSLGAKGDVKLVRTSNGNLNIIAPGIDFTSSNIKFNGLSIKQMIADGVKDLGARIAALEQLHPCEDADIKRCTDAKKVPCTKGQVAACKGCQANYEEKSGKCVLKTCEPTQLPGSDKEAKGSIAGVVGSKMEMTCKKGFQTQLKVTATCTSDQKFKFTGACNACVQAGSSNSKKLPHCVVKSCGKQVNVAQGATCTMDQNEKYWGGGKACQQLVDGNANSWSSGSGRHVIPNTGLVLTFKKAKIINSVKISQCCNGDYEFKDFQFSTLKSDGKTWERVAEYFKDPPKNKFEVFLDRPVETKALRVHVAGTKSINGAKDTARLVEVMAMGWDGGCLPPCEETMRCTAKSNVALTATCVMSKAEVAWGGGTACKQLHDNNPSWGPGSGRHVVGGSFVTLTFKAKSVIDSVTVSQCCNKDYESTDFEFLALVNGKWVSQGKYIKDPPANKFTVQFPKAVAATALKVQVGQKQPINKSGVNYRLTEISVSGCSGSQAYLGNSCAPKKVSKCPKVTNVAKGAQCTMDQNERYWGGGKGCQQLVDGNANSWSSGSGRHVIPNTGLVLVFKKTKMIQSVKISQCCNGDHEFTNFNFQTLKSDGKTWANIAAYNKKVPENKFEVTFPHPVATNALRVHIGGTISINGSKDTARLIEVMAMGCDDPN